MKLRLKELRLEHGLTQELAGKIVYVNQSMYCRYETGQLALPVTAAEDLALYYNVSMDYLMGLSNVKLHYERKNGNEQ